MNIIVGLMIVGLIIVGLIMEGLVMEGLKVGEVLILASATFLAYKEWSTKKREVTIRTPYLQISKLFISFNDNIKKLGFSTEDMQKKDFYKNKKKEKKCKEKYRIISKTAKEFFMIMDIYIITNSIKDKKEFSKQEVGLIFINFLFTYKRVLVDYFSDKKEELFFVNKKLIMEIIEEEIIYTNQKK